MAGTTATITVLFTDVVGSTARLSELGEVRGREVFDLHHRVLSDAIDRHGGEEAKWLGDGVMAVFASAADAVRCAIDMQRRARSAPGRTRLDIRVGLALGEATRDGDDWFGTPVVTASRLCAAAGPGEILCPELVAAVLGGFEDLAFLERGPLELKGIPKPVAACEVRYEPAVSRPDRPPLVGRDDDLERLTNALRAAAGGRGAVALLVGEPGIGKTRLAEEVASVAQEDGGFVVGWGRCLEEPGAPTLRPWVQAVRQLASTVDTTALAGRMGHRWPVVVDVIPELDPERQVPAPPALEPNAARFRLHDALAELLRAISEVAPVLVVLDDLHWADASSLTLLEHVAADAGGWPLFVLGTYRDVDVWRGHPLSDTLGVLARAPSFSRHPLSGLDVAGAAALVAAFGVGDEAGIAALHARTEGNPFFLGEVAQLVVTGGMTAVPEGVRDVVGRRLDRLGPDANAVLTVAAVLGRDVDVALLAGCVDLEEDAVIEAVEEALAARVLTDEGTRPGQVRFVHALVREALVAELSSLRRIRLHRRVAAELEAGRGTRPVDSSALAHHLLEAAPAGDATRAVEVAMQAAGAAIRRYGYDEAAGWYERCLQALELAEGTGDRLACTVLLRLSDALRAMGRVDDAAARAAEAAELAGRAGWHDLLGAAALAVAGPPEDTAITDVSGVPILERAVAALEDAGDSPLRAMVLARHGVHLVDLPGDRGHRVTAEALAMARRTGDPQALAYVLRAWARAVMDPLRLDERVAVADELVELGRSLHDLEVETWGHRWRIIAHWELGSYEIVDRELDALQELADQLHQPFHEWGWVARRAGRALMAGRLAEADELTTRALTLAFEMNSSFSLGASGALLIVLRWWQGRVDEVIPMLEARAQGTAPLRAAAAFMRALVGDRDEAVAWLDGFDPVAATGGVGLLRLLAGGMLAETSALLADEGAATVAYGMLEPVNDLMVVSPPGIVSVMPVEHALGVAAAVRGDLDESEVRLGRALDRLRGMGAEGLVPHTQLALARTLRARGHAGAGDLAREALAAATGMGAHGVVLVARASGL